MKTLALVVVTMSVASMGAIEGEQPGDEWDRTEEETEEDAEPVVQGLTFGSPGNRHYCKNGPCGHGGGDCDRDRECKGDLVCGYNNCREMHPGMDHVYRRSYDCCENMQPFHRNYCFLNPGCKHGEGDCDYDSECGDGLVCGRNNCRELNPGVNPFLIRGRADCCTTCGGATTVKSGTETRHPPSSFVDRKAVSAERTLANPPGVLEAAAVYSLPPLAPGDEIKLECCAQKGEACNFFVAVYHCPPCSRGKNGGIPGFLLSQSWRGSSCAPIFTPAGSSQTQTMTVFHKTLQAGETLDIPVSTDAPHVAVFSTSQNVGEDWCPAKNNVKPGTTGPNRPCVCL
eukprot:TRINITY_DN273_c0_g2_i6.p1 TRINITY_DN273_c0_g2~~TRINITY_DN273_c0_g2_i6.p1  ORF type:complete len:351 (+),score=106.13 TRINITY_DN273_c0_g2_i6:30-1055(+)